MKKKFKKGDKVRIKDGSKIKSSMTWLPAMEYDIGVVDEVAYVDHDGDCRLKKTMWIMSPKWLEHAYDHDIVIERHGNKVVAKNGTKVGVAKCAPDDDFDMYEGARIALARLFGKEVEEDSHSFKVGDVVVANREANYHYTITKDGWVGVVTGFDDDKVIVKGRGVIAGYDHFKVDPKHFDLAIGKEDI